jgi:putative thiamine transport system permease protein
MSLSAAAVLAGLTLLALWSVAGPWRFPDALPDGLTLRSWETVLPGMAGPVRDTLLLAGTASFIAVVLALGALEHHARKDRSDAGPALNTLYVPLLVPQVAFLFGLQVLLSLAGLDGRFVAVLIAHLVFVFPYVLLSLSDPWWSFDPRYARAVRALGHGPNAVFWRVRLPMLLRPIAVAGALGFAVSVALYLPTLMIGGGRWPTVTTEAVALASGGDRGLIGATALLQAVLPFLGFAVAAALPAVLFRRRRLMRSA